VTQPIERAAHRRLAQTDAISRPSDMALGQQGLERDEEIEIDGTKIHNPTIIRRTNYVRSKINFINPVFSGLIQPS